MDLTKYGVAYHLYKPVIKRSVVDFAVSADWTPAAGDVKISKDGAAAANVTNLPTAITMGNTAMWDFSLTATEMQAAQIKITVSDSVTKAVEDTMFEIATYGNVSALHAIDLDDAVRAGLTALPNANAEAAGGLFTRGTGAGQINQQANGQVDSNIERVRNSVISTLIAGRIDSSVGIISAGAIDATAIATDAIGSAEFSQAAADKIWSSTTRTLSAFGFSVTVGTNNDKTGYSLSAAAIQAIWDALTSALTTVGSIGKLLVDNINATISSRLASASYVAPDNTGISSIKTQTDKLAFTVTNQVDANILGIESLDPTNQIRDSILSDTVLISGANLNDLTSTIPLSVWTFTDGINDRKLTSLSNFATILTGTDITNIWAKLLTAITVVGSIGKLIKDNLDALISSRLASASYIAPDNTGISNIKTKTDNLPTDPADASDIAASFTTVNTKLDTIDDFIDTEVAAIKVVTDKLNSTLEVSGINWRFTVDALFNAPSGGGSGGVTPDQIWDLVNGIETGLTPRQAMRLISAVLAGDTIVNGNNIVFRNALANTKDRISADGSVLGDRTFISVDPT